MSALATPVTYGLDSSIARFSVSRYHHMIEVGVLTGNDKVELLENDIVLKFPRTPRHDGTCQAVLADLMPRTPPGWMWRSGAAIVLSDSQPEPDFSLARGDPRTYLSRYPESTDVGLVIEVADTSLIRDQRDKTRIYARAGIACYWIVNLVDRCIEVYTQPSGPTAVPSYGDSQTYHPGDSIPLVLDGNTVGTLAVANLLP